LRYTFRTAPLRNLKAAPAFFHNGTFGTLEAAIAHHLDVEASLRSYDPDANNVPFDLVPGPFAGMIAAGIDPLVQDLTPLSKKEFRDLVTFVRDGLFDQRVLQFCQQVPRSVQAACRSSALKAASKGSSRNALVSPALGSQYLSHNQSEI